MLNRLERLFENSKFRLFLALWTTASCAALIFFANRSFQSELSAPVALISKLNLTDLNSKDVARLQAQWPLILRELQEVRGLFQALNIESSFLPIEMKISSSEPLEFKVTSDVIELGISYALGFGQMPHALLQSWLLQSSPAHTYSEHLHQILFADIFWAAAHSRFELGIAGSKDVLAITKAEADRAKSANILLQVASSETTLASDWAPQGLRRQPRSTKSNLASKNADSKNLINPLSLRKFFLSHILKYQYHLSLNARIEFLKNLTSLASRHSPSRIDLLTLKDLGQFVTQTFSSLGIPIVTTSYPFKVDILFVAKEETPSADPKIMSFISQAGQKLTLKPGNIILNDRDLKDISINTLIFQVKSLAELHRFESTRFKAKKILAIENPHNELVNFDSLMTLDFDRFARVNRKIQFAVFDQGSLNFAAKKNLAEPLARLLKLPNNNVQRLAGAASDALGLSNPHWESSSQTYRFIGAIEALQMWRPSIQN